MDVYGEYRQKLRTPDEAVRCINSGDWVDYTVSLAFPQLLDAALARRKEELHDVKIRGNLLFGPIQTVECDPSREHFIYNTWHCSEYERKLCDRGLCNYIPMVFHNVVPYYEHFLTVNVAMVAVTPMDRHGYFNLSCSTGTVKGIVDRADIVILEVNERLPRVFGGFGDCIHISEADYVVEGEHPPLPEFVPDEPTDIERSIAGHIFPYIPDGANLQLGIGGMPGVVGEMSAPGSSMTGWTRIRGLLSARWSLSTTRRLSAASTIWFPSTNASPSTSSARYPPRAQASGRSAAPAASWTSFWGLRNPTAARPSSACRPPTRTGKDTGTAISCRTSTARS